MVVGIDIGNTNIDIALFNSNGRIVYKSTKPTRRADITPLLIKIRKRNKIGKIIVVSVVPKALAEVKSSLKGVFKGTKVAVVGSDIKVPLKCAYNKREIGQDRLVTAFAAKTIYGLPILIIDFGTAVTFDTVSKNGTYLGGLILPGIKMSLESLSERTAMLPRTYLARTRSFIGKNTVASIRGGMIYGYSAICDGLIKLFKKRIDRNINVVATGGDAALIGKYTLSMRKINPDLSLQGLYFLSKDC